MSILKLKLRQKCGGEILQKTHFAHGNFISYPLEKYSTLRLMNQKVCTIARRLLHEMLHLTCAETKITLQRSQWKWNEI